MCKIHGEEQDMPSEENAQLSDENDETLTETRDTITQVQEGDEQTNESKEQGINNSSNETETAMVLSSKKEVMAISEVPDVDDLKGS